MRQDELTALGFSSPEERMFGELLAEGAGRLCGSLPAEPEPRIEGRSGYDGSDYARPGRRLWVAARGLVRRAVPGLWI